jgi:putative ABC transport system permease protein
MLIELRLAARRLVRDPWAAITALVTVALGAGVAVAVFAAGYGLLVRPLSYDSDGRLRLLDTRARQDAVERWRSELRSSERLTSYASEGLVITGLGDARRIRGAYVDDWFFDTLTVRPVAGRLLSRGAGSEAVISERLARAAALSPGAAIGTGITAGGAALTIVGVLPETFAFPAASTDVWIPAHVAKPVPLGRLADARQFRLAALIRPGVSDASASAELEAVRRTLDPQAKPRESRELAVQSAHLLVTRDVRSTIVVLAAAAALLWIVTCANLATILIGRAIARRRELAVLHALGAGAWRRLASILSEATLIAAAGTLLGLGLAAASLRTATAWAHELIVRPGEIRMDAAPLAFAAAAAIALTILATALAVPALQRSAGHLQSQHTSATPRDRRTRAALLVSQVALVVVLISGGALLVRTVAGLLRTDLGLDPRNTIVSDLVLTPTTAYQASTRWPTLQELLDRIRAVPGVRSAGAGSSLPPSQEQLEITTNFQGPNGEVSHRLSAAIVTPGYLEAIGARLLDGRPFAGSDLAGSPTVVLSESAARAAFGSVAATGRELPFNLPGVNDQRRARVVGVVGDIRYSGLEALADAAIYVPWHLAPMGQGFLAIETHGRDAAPTLAAVRAMIRELDPALPHTPMRQFDEIVAQSIGVRRIAAQLAAMLALLAFGIALVGLAGNVLRSVAERRRELAIRAALGAAPSGLVRHVASEVVLLSAVGLVVGIAAALAAGGMLRSLIAGVRPYDAATLGGVATLVLAASLLTSCIPASRAARINPAEVLKD